MRIIRLKEVIYSTGLARSTIYKYIGEGTFPKPVSLGGRCVGWVDAEVQEWILARIKSATWLREMPHTADLFANTVVSISSWLGNTAFSYVCAPHAADG